MYTSIVLVALSGMAAAPVDAADSPVWLTDYAAAYAQGHKQKKPLAVVFGNGKEGADALCKEGKLDRDVLDAMQNRYVCVYIDLNKGAGKGIAEAFKVTSGPALVLTDRDLDNIALRHSGTVAKADLMRGLQKYGDPERVVQVTDTDLTAEVRYYPPAATTVGGGTIVPGYTTVPTYGYVPAYPTVPTYGYAPGYAPAAGPAYYGGGFGGGCAGGRCR